MKKYDIVNLILKNVKSTPIISNISLSVHANIAICKYWGKKNNELNIPHVDSISLPMTNYGCKIYICQNKNITHQLFINNKKISPTEIWSEKLFNFINLFHKQIKNICLNIKLELNIPIASGLASSSCIYASIVKGLDKFFQWNLSNIDLSILARLGSGSASRSVYKNSFVYWRSGCCDDGMDSYSIALKETWEDLILGIIIIDRRKKYISSSQAMNLSVETSFFYKSWQEKSTLDCKKIISSIKAKSFLEFGQLVENNSLSLTSLMLSTYPPILYISTSTLKTIKKIWYIREKENIPIFFTQDAGPNIKLLFQKKYTKYVKKIFSNILLIEPFQK